MKVKNFIKAYKKHPVLYTWQLLNFIHVIPIKILFCLSIALFQFDYKMFFVAWEETN